MACSSQRPAAAARRCSTPPKPSTPSKGAHWQIHQAHCDYQEVAEDRRHLAVDVGEIVRAFLDELVTAGWSEQEARDANVHELAGSAEAQP